jgi:hypothetical protein
MKFVKDAPLGTSGRREFSGASELCCYQANCKRVVSDIIITTQVLYKCTILHKITEFYTK